MWWRQVYSDWYKLMNLMSVYDSTSVMCCIINFFFVFFFVFGCFFFFNDTATTEIYTLSLHDALPIWGAFVATETKFTPFHNGTCCNHGYILVKTQCGKFNCIIIPSHNSTYWNYRFILVKNSVISSTVLLLPHKCNFVWNGFKQELKKKLNCFYTTNAQNLLRKSLTKF